MAGILGRFTRGGAGIGEMLAAPAIQRAFAFVDADAERVTAELIELCEIEAPPFHETARGDWFLERFRELGLSGVGRDVEGNVIGVRPGVSDGPVTVISAHLDTIFPPGTDCRVRRVGTRLLAPGISDD